MKKSVLLKRGGIAGLVIMGVCVVLALSMLINLGVIARRDKNNPLWDAFLFEKSGNGKTYVLSGVDLSSLNGENQTAITRYELPSRYEGAWVAAVGGHAFKENLEIEELVVPRSYKRILMFAFYGCENLETVEFSRFSKLNAIGKGAFAHSGLTSITIPKGVEVMGKWVFTNCENLTDIYCEAESMPEGWDSGWLGNCNATVHWGA